MPDQRRVRNREFAAAVLLVLLVGVAIPVTGSVASMILASGRRWEFLSFHSAIAVASGIFALMLGGILVAARKRESNTQHRLWMSAALVGMGMLDIAHSIVAPGEVFVWFHSTSTFVGGVLFALVWLPAWAADSPRRRPVLPLTFVAVLTLIVFSLAFPHLIPAMVEWGAFTVTARGLNVLGGLGFLVAAGWFLKRYWVTRERDECLLACVCSLFGVAGVLFELSSVWGGAWWWWHLVRLMAYALAIGYSAIIYQRMSEQLRGEIADRRQAETALRISEQKYRGIFETQRDAIFIADVETNTLVGANQQASALVGWSVEELVGRSITVLHPPEMEKETLGVFQSLAEDSEAAELEWSVVHKNGTIIPVAILATRLEYEGQQVMLGHFRDITERKRVDQEQQLEFARITSILDNIPDGVYIVNQQCDVEYVNPVIEREFGPVGGRKCYEYLHDRTEACPWCKIPEVLAGKSVRWEWYSFKNDRYYDLFDTPFKNTDGSVSKMEIFHDITEHKQAEQERERLVADLESKNAELGRFAYTVSHDLKSPLLTITGFVEMLKRDIDRGDADRIKEDMATIAGAAEKMGQLLDGVLDLSRIGRAANEPEEIALGELIQNALEMLEGRIESLGVEVIISPDLPVVVGDRPRLLEVWLNLIDNAAKYMGDQARPRIEIGVGLDDHPEKRAVCYVRDNGMGIDPRYHDRVFDLFDQLDPEVEGTGIGLALVKRIVEVHEGKVWIESESSEIGSTFWFTLPRKGTSNGHELPGLQYGDTGHSAR